MTTIKTGYKVYTVEEVLEEFCETVTLGIGNFDILIEYLTNPDLATKIEEYKEENEILYFYIGGYWVKAGQNPNPPTTTDIILLDAPALELYEIKDKISYCKLRSSALSYMIMFLKGMKLKKYRRYYKTSKSWCFNRWGFPVREEVDVRHFPLRKIQPWSPYKKDLLKQLGNEKIEWENAARQLRELQKDMVAETLMTIIRPVK